VGFAYVRADAFLSSASISYALISFSWLANANACWVSWLIVNVFVWFRWNMVLIF